MSELLFGVAFLKWAIELLQDLASGKKSIEKTRAEAAKGFRVSETDSDEELTHWE